MAFIPPLHPRYVERERNTVEWFHCIHRINSTESPTPVEWFWQIYRNHSITAIRFCKRRRPICHPPLHQIPLNKQKPPKHDFGGFHDYDERFRTKLFLQILGTLFVGNEIFGFFTVIHKDEMAGNEFAQLRLLAGKVA